MDPYKRGAFIKQLRLERHMTQLQAAERIGVSDRELREWERGESTPKPENLKSMAEVFEVSELELYAGERLTIETKSESKMPCDSEQSIETSQEIAAAENASDVEKKKVIEKIESDKMAEEENQTQCDSTLPIETSTQSSTSENASEDETATTISKTSAGDNPTIDENPEPEKTNWKRVWEYVGICFLACMAYLIQGSRLGFFSEINADPFSMYPLLFLFFVACSSFCTRFKFIPKGDVVARRTFKYLTINSLILFFFWMMFCSALAV